MKKIFGFGVAWLLASGAAFAGQTYPFPHVVDSKGKVVGYYSGPSNVTFRLPNGRLVFSVFYETGFVSPIGSAFRFFHYLSDDCTGTRYLPSDSVPPEAFVNPGTGNLLYPDTNPTVITVRSLKSGSSGCLKLSGKFFGAPAKVIPLKDLGFTPPFKVELN